MLYFQKIFSIAGYGKLSRNYNYLVKKSGQFQMLCHRAELIFNKNATSYQFGNSWVLHFLGCMIAAATLSNTYELDHKQSK